MIADDEGLDRLTEVTIAAIRTVLKVAAVAGIIAAMRVGALVGAALLAACSPVTPPSWC